MGKRLRQAAATVCALAAVGVVALAGSIVAGATPSLPSTGNGIVPTSMDGSSIFAECSTALTGENHIFGLKAEKSGAVSNYNGTFDKTNAPHTHGSDNPLSVTIQNAQVSGGVATFDWSANMPVDFVYVKAGTTATVYDYRAYGWGGHPATGPWSDTGLVSPKDSISHVLFCTIKKLRVEKTAVPSFTREYTWTVDKKVKTSGSFGDSAALTLEAGSFGSADWRISVDQTGSNDTNVKVAGVITVLDSSPFDASGILDESLSNVTFSGSCSPKSGANDKATFSVGKGKTITCLYSALLAQKADGTNTVVADPTTPDWMVSTTASKAYAFGAPTSEINKTVNWQDSNGRSKGGITADDTTDYQTTNPCGESRKVTNTVSLYGGAKDALGSDTATLDITCSAPQPLTVAKTANPSFTRTYDWKVTKTADPSRISLKDGATGSSTWTVKLEQDGEPVDSGWYLTGTIAVTNPNAFAVSGVSVADGLGGTVTCPASTIAAKSSMTCSYSVGLESGAPGTNTATATTTTQGVGSGSGSAQYAFTEPTDVVNANVDVVDTNGKTWNDRTGGFTDSYPSGVLPCRDVTYSNTVRAVGDEGAILSTSTATVTVTCSTTPPPPPVPVIDIGVTKSATTPTKLNGNVTYTIVVSSLGPDAANGVQVADPAPGGVGYLSASSSDASVTCSVEQGGALVSCSRPGTFSPGQSFVVTVVGKATKTGTLTNTVTVSTTGDSKASNNQASASTLVVAPVTPPKPKPKPQPKPQVCSTLTVAPKTVTVGKAGKLTLTVKAGGKPLAGARIRIKGAGVDRVVKTGKNGLVTTAITAPKAGIVVVSITGRKGCNTARVGVIGVFEPPVTG